MYVKLIKNNGVVKVNIDGKVIEPLAFRSFRPTERNISDFSKAGTKLMNIFSTGLNSALGVPYSTYGESWLGNGQYDFDAVDRQIGLFLNNAPDTYFGLKIQVDTRPWFLKENPGTEDTFIRLSQTAADDKWRKEAAEYLKAMISHVEEKYGDRFYGYYILGGSTTEWFSRIDEGESSPAKEGAFRKYINDPEATIPDRATRNRCSAGSFRDPATDRAAINYWRFHNELIADTILYFAAEAQSVIKHEKLLGVYFGYIFELRGATLCNFGHMAYERVYCSGDIDLIATPASYRYRKHDSTSAVMIAYDSLALHNKLQFLSFDNITHLAPQYIEGKPIPGYDSKLSSEQEAVDVMRRDFIFCITRGSGHWWFDMFEGWFYSEGLMNEVKREIAMGDRILASGRDMSSAAEIAVFVEGAESLYYLDHYSNINTDLLGSQREGLARMGEPYDVYSICDLGNPGIDHGRYKLYIFVNQFKISDETRQAIENKVKKSGRTILWIYAPDYIQDSSVSLQSLSDMTGINIKLKEATDVPAVDASNAAPAVKAANAVSVNVTGANAGQDAQAAYAAHKAQAVVAAVPIASAGIPDANIIEVGYGDKTKTVDRYGFNNAVKTQFYAEDDNAVTWGKYKANGRAALVYKKITVTGEGGSYNSFYSAAGNIPAGTLRAIAEFAGVHIYNYGRDPVYINQSLIGVYATADGVIELKLKDNRPLKELFEDKGYLPGDRTLKLTMQKGNSKLFMIE